MDKSPCESKIFTLGQVYRLYSDNLLVKPRMQRKVKWVDKDPTHDKTNNNDFIRFTLKLKNSILPILMSTKYQDNKLLYSVLDGNNRINALS